MRVSVRGNTLLMDQAQALYPDFLTKLRKPDDSVNTLLRDLLVELGLTVEINGVTYEKDCGPYSKIDLPGPDDEDEEEDYDLLSYTR